MNVYACNYKDDAWDCFVVAGTRGEAKSLFHSSFHSYCSENLYTDVRSSIVKRGVQIPAGVYDIDCPELEQIGLRYLSAEEME